MMHTRRGFQQRDPWLLRAQLRWIILMTLVVTAGALLYSFLHTPMYTTHADVLVQPRLFSVSSSPKDPDMGTEQAVATSDNVLFSAADAVGVPPQVLAGGRSVTVPPNTHVLRFSQTARQAADAQRFSEALAAAYVAYQASIETAAQKGTPATPSEIITAARLPSSPSSPNHLADLGFGLLIGLTLGVGTAFVRDRIDNRVRSVTDLEQLAGVAVMGEVPAVRYDSAGPRARLVTLTAPDSDAAHAYRELRTRTVYAMRGGGKVLLVTSPTPAGHAVVAANLAVSLAQSGLTVTLVAADPAGLQPGAMFDLPDEELGLTEVIREGASLDTALRKPVPRLAVLPRGSTGGDQGLLLGDGAVGTVLSTLAAEADVVIVVAPAVLSDAVTGVLAEFADLALLVVDAKQTTRRDVTAATARLEPLRPVLIGSVLDNVGNGQPLPPPAEPPAPEPEPTSSRGGGSPRSARNRDE